MYKQMNVLERNYLALRSTEYKSLAKEKILRDLHDYGKKKYPMEITEQAFSIGCRKS